MSDFYEKDEIPAKLKTKYPNFLTYESSEKRKANINSFVNFILKDIEENDLVYGEKERRIKLYSTSKKESIYIQYPGKFSRENRNGNSIPFDFKPIAILEDGAKSIDLTLENLWNSVEEYIKKYKDFVKLLNTIFFRMGRMIDYYFVENEFYSSDIIDQESVFKDEDINLSLYKFNFSDENLMESINHYSNKFNAGNGNEMSLEAFVYYLELLLQIEECKYNWDYENESCYKKLSRTGRVSTTDSLIIITSYLDSDNPDKISLSTLIDRFVKGRGVPSEFKDDEYVSATYGIVEIKNLKLLVKKYLEKHSIQFIKSNKKIKGIPPFKFIINQKNAVVGDGSINEFQMNILKDKGYYSYFDINSFMDEEILDEIIQLPDSFEYKIKTLKDDLIRNDIKVTKLQTRNQCYVIKRKKIIISNSEIYFDSNSIYFGYKVINLMSKAYKEIVHIIETSESFYTHDEVIYKIKEYCNLHCKRFSNDVNIFDDNFPKDKINLSIPYNKIIVGRNYSKNKYHIPDGWKYFVIKDNTSETEIKKILQYIRN